MPVLSWGSEASSSILAVLVQAAGRTARTPRRGPGTRWELSVAVSHSFWPFLAVFRENHQVTLGTGAHGGTLGAMETPGLGRSVCPAATYAQPHRTK